ncbi:HV01 protein, partial [Aegithalos caudatus]|nr:HV01 protein [Aegithalos caudatus]
AQPRLQEGGGGLRAPGDSVTLSCRRFGFTLGSRGIWWYRQAPGGSLEWVSLINYDSTFLYFDPSMQGRATTWDSSHSGVFLYLLTLHPDDSARYFCAIAHG